MDRSRGIQIRCVATLVTPVLALLAAFSSGQLACAQEAGPEQAAEAVAVDGRLDRSGPVRVDLWFNRPSGPAANQFRSPLLLGFVIEKGEIHRPWALEWSWHGAGDGPEQRPWTHCPYGFIGGRGRGLVEHFERLEAVLEGEVLRGQTRFEFNRAGQPGHAVLEIAFTGKLQGRSARGAYRVQSAGQQAEGAVVGILRPASFAAIDPANAIYQFEWQQAGPVPQWMAVVEMRDGEPIAAHARGLPVTSFSGYRPAGAAAATAVPESNLAALGTLHPVDASELKMTIDAPSLQGRGVTLDGALVVAGQPPLRFEKLPVPASGRGGAGRIAVYMHSPRDPVAGRWRRWMEAIWTGPRTADADLMARARTEADTLPALPAPGPAADYLHRHIEAATDRRVGFSCIYAPWFDFQPVAGAARYRFQVMPGDLSFEAPSPRATLAPMWASVPRGSFTVNLQALDAAGAPLGQPQRRQAQRRPGVDAALATAPVDQSLALELALRHPRTLAAQHFSYAELFGQLQAQAGDDVRAIGDTPIIHMMPNAWAAIVRASEDEAEVAWARPLSDLWAGHYYRPGTAALNTSASDWGFPYGYKSMTFHAAQDIGRMYFDAFEATGNRQWIDQPMEQTAGLRRLQQPSGSWTLIHTSFKQQELWDPWGPYFTFFGNAWLDHNGAPYAHFLGRLRRLSGDDRHRDSELKAWRWVLNNALRSGYWESQEQQGNGGNLAPTTNTMALDALLYVLRYAPPTTADLALAEELARYVEDRFVSWGPVSEVVGGNMQDNGQMRLALVYLELYRQTGDPLHLVRADALFDGNMRLRDPVRGLTAMRFDRYMSERDEPWHSVEFVRLRRQIKPLASPDLSSGVVSLTLDRAIEGAERVVVHLDVRDGRVRQAAAVTPTWEAPGVDFTQPGRQHHTAGKALFHDVDASGLRVSAQGISGTLRAMLQRPPVDDELVRVYRGAFGDTGVENPLPASEPRMIEATYEIDLTPRDQRFIGEYRQEAKTGRATAQVRTATAGLRANGRLWFEIDQAIDGGAAWQNWGVARLDVKDGRLSGARLSNNNAGWQATIASVDGRIDGDHVEGLLRVKLDWIGFIDLLKPGRKDGDLAAAWAQGGGRGLLAWWEIDDGYFSGWHPRPLARAGHPFIYLTAHKPVRSGVYELAFAGQLIGDIVAGSVTVAAPGGATRRCQMLGALEPSYAVGPVENAPVVEPVDSAREPAAPQVACVGHQDWVQTVAFTPDGSILVSASLDGTVRYWNAITGAALSSDDAHGAAVLSLAISPDGRLLASGDTTGTIRVRPLEGGKPLAGFAPFDGAGHVGHLGTAVGALAFSPDGLWLAGTGRQRLRLWNVADGSLHREIASGRQWMTAVAFSPDSRWLAYAMGWGETTVLDVASGQPVARLEDRRGMTPGHALAFSPDGRYLVSSSGAKALVWDLHDARRQPTAPPLSLDLLRDRVVTYGGHGLPGIYAVAFAPAGDVIASGGIGDELHLWRAASGEPIRRVPVQARWMANLPHSAAVQTLAFSPDGQRIAVAGRDRIVRIYPLAAGKDQ